MRRAGAALRRPGPLLLGIAALVYLAFRAAVLHFGFDTVAIPSFEVSNIGSLARMTSEGRSGIPLYLYYDNCGGHLVTGLLAAPLYALFGSSYLVLKLVPVLLGLGCLLLVARILDRHASRRAAVLGVLLFALGPPTLTKFSMLAQGNHFENLIFQIATYALFLRLHGRGSTPGRLLGLGALAGFSLFFYFGTTALLAGLAATHLVVRGARGTLADLRWALPGFALGVSPLVALAFAPNGQVQRFLAAKLAPIGAPGAWPSPIEKTTDLLGSVLPGAGRFEALGPVPGTVAEFLYLSSFALAWIAAAVALARAAASRPVAEPATAGGSSGAGMEIARLGPLLLHLPMLVILLSITEFNLAGYGPPVEVGRYRYLVPHFAFAALLIPLGIEHLLRRGASLRALGRALAAGSAATCLFTLPLLAGAGSETGLARRYPGFVPRSLALMVLHDWDRDPVTNRRVWDHARAARRLADLSAWEHHGAMEGVGHMLAWESLFPPDRRHGDPIGALPLCDLARVYGEPYAVDLARGAGGLLRRFARTMGASEDVAQALREILGSDEPLAPYVAEGLCLEFAYPLARQTGADLAASRALRTLVPEPHRAAWTRGFGLQCGRAIGRGIPSDVKAALAAAREVAVGEEDDFWLGVGWGLADQAEDPPSAAELARLLADVPRERRARACEGFGRALRHLAGAPIAASADAAGAGLAPEELAGLERGARWDGYPAR